MTLLSLRFYLQPPWFRVRLEEHNQHFFTITITNDGPNEKNVFMLKKPNRENYQSRKK